MSHLIMLIEPLTEDASKMGLKVDSIGATVRERLNAAGIRDSNYRRIDSPDQKVLCVTVTVKAAIFTLQVRYCKWDQEFDEPSSDSLWEDQTTGNHNNSVEPVLNQVKALTNKFTDAYRKSYSNA